MARPRPFCVPADACDLVQRDVAEDHGEQRRDEQNAEAEDETIPSTIDATAKPFVR